MNRSLFRCLSLLALLAAAGCGGGGKGQTATVSGKVTLPGGKPLPGGHIDFHAGTDAQPVASARIQEDGTYEAVGVPDGECRVTVENAELRQATRAASAAKMPGSHNAGTYVQINSKYARAESSPLSTTVVGKKFTYDVELK